MMARRVRPKPVPIEAWEADDMQERRFGLSSSALAWCLIKVCVLGCDGRTRLLSRVLDEVHMKS